MPREKHSTKGAAENCLKALWIYMHGQATDKAQYKSLANYFRGNENATHKWGQIFGYMSLATQHDLLDLCKQTADESWRPFPGLVSMYGYLQAALKEHGLRDRKVQCSGSENTHIGDCVCSKIRADVGISDESRKIFKEAMSEIVQEVDGALCFPIRSREYISDGHPFVVPARECRIAL